MFRFEKHFTLEEANALIPAVRQVFSHVHALVLAEQGGEEQADAPAKNGNGHTNGNGHGIGDKDGPKPSLLDLAAEYSGMSRELKSKAATKLLQALEEKGIVIQDFMRGLIDFPALRDGREVFLCYELADGDRIQFYHDLEAGFAGRTPLDDKD